MSLIKLIWKLSSGCGQDTADIKDFMGAVSFCDCPGGVYWLTCTCEVVCLRTIIAMA